MNRVRLAILVAAALIAVAVGIPRIQGAKAGAEVCNPSGSCVILIEVDGLEAKDVTPQTTPFLWALAHSGQNVAADTNVSPVAIGATQVPGIAGRNGFMWAAARGVMGASTLSSTMSLLTGGYPEQDNVPADDFQAIDGQATDGRFALGADTDTEAAKADQNPVAQAKPVGPDYSDAQTIPALMENAASDSTSSTGKPAVILGDPRLAPVFGFNQDGTANGNHAVDTSRYWAPATTDSVPAYCPIPQEDGQAQDQESEYQNQKRSCPTPDLNTIKHAGDILTGADGASVSFAYIELAELGAVKRLYGDVDNSTTPAGQRVLSQLAATDAAIGSLAARLANQGFAQWSKTVLVVVGDHGYQTTPPTHRVPDPDHPTNPGMGLSDYVADKSEHTATFIPDGSIGFVYAKDTSKLQAVADGLRTDVDKSQLCQATGTLNVDPTVASVGSGCIQEVLATGAVDDQGHSTISGIKSVQDVHPYWHLHYVDPKTGKPGGSDGQLMVVLKPGWAAGVLVPMKDADKTTNPDPTTIYGGPTDNGSASRIENPYVGTDGGPRNRSIAAIINGPSGIVQQVRSTTSYPASTQPVDPDNCPPDVPVDQVVADPNVDPSDDANLPGHLCQAETVDFAPTIAALLGVAVPSTQLGGRFLKEAFKIQLGLPQEEEIPPPQKDDAPPPPEEPDVHIPEPPPPPKGFDFDGLLRGLTATVVDVNGCTWDTAPSGAHMDYLRIEADLGKQLESTTLTFYQRKATPAGTATRRGKTRGAFTAAAGAGPRSKCVTPRSSARAHAAAAPPRPPLSAIARFKPFALKRGHVLLRLRIPDLYKPTHVGIFVQEARKLSVPQVGPDGQPGPTFEPFGPAAGDIVEIADAAHLHAVKPGGRGTSTHHGKGKRRK